MSLSVSGAGIRGFGRRRSFLVGQHGGGGVLLLVSVLSRCLIWVLSRVFGRTGVGEVVEVEIGNSGPRPSRRSSWLLLRFGRVAQDAAGLGCEFRTAHWGEHDQRDEAGSAAWAG